MDPLTHIVIGRAVVAAAPNERRSRAIGAAAILGALSPDVDSAIAFSGWDRYVRAHQFGTHSLVGAVAMAALTAFVVQRSSRILARRAHSRSAEAFALRRASATTSEVGRRAKASAERFQAVLGAAAAGAMSHLALDLTSGARIAILWPLVDRRFSLPLVAMADPWLIGLCIVWLLLRWPARLPLRPASQAVIAITVAFLCFKAAMLGVALRHSKLAAEQPSAIEARWGSLTGWFVFERLANAVRASTIATDGGPSLVMTRPVGSDTPLVRASRSLDDVRNFLAVHDFAFPSETSDGERRVSVMWSDLRYCSPTGCGVWVGGTFDATGRPIIQEVRVGAVVQRRPP
jgi:membrane-bound metal-dependent hydrolase YbcI (DUF457 family)